MATRILDSGRDKRLQPANGLWKLYSPEDAPYSFKAKTSASARNWQRRTRKALADTLGLARLPSCPLRATRIESVDKGDYVREKILLRTTPDSVMPVYLLLPKKLKRPLPVVVAFHGHGYGVKDIVGLWDDGKERDTPDGYHKDFGVALCRAGFAVAAPEISCFGERQSRFPTLNGTLGQNAPGTCYHTAMLSFHLGLSVIGIRVNDGLRLVDYLETRRDLDVSRLGAMGISGGGLHTFFSSAIDTRINACVISGYYSTFRESVFAMEHCACNYCPGLGDFGEMYDMVGMIAPRPLLVEAGNYDFIFPITSVKKSVAKARAVYDIFNARDQVSTDYFEGRHQISGRKAYEFLRYSLGLEIS